MPMFTVANVLLTLILLALVAAVAILAAILMYVARAEGRLQVLNQHVGAEPAKLGKPFHGARGSGF